MHLSRGLAFARRNAIAFVALIVALSGTAYAANQIGAQDIKRNAIRSPHIKAGQVKPSDLASSVRSKLGGGGLAVTRVEGADLFMQPGEFGGAPLARCPRGTVVVGTGFYGPFSAVGGFVLSYGTFVGGFFANETSIALEGHVQAICAKPTGSGGASSSQASQLKRYRADVEAAEAAIQGS